MALFVLPIYVGLYLFQIYKKIEANIYSQTYKMKCTNEKSEILKNYINWPKKKKKFCYVSKDETVWTVLDLANL